MVYSKYGLAFQIVLFFCQPNSSIQFKTVKNLIFFSNKKSVNG